MIAFWRNRAKMIQIHFKKKTNYILIPDFTHFCRELQNSDFIQVLPLYFFPLNDFFSIVSIKPLFVLTVTDHS